MSSEHMWRLLKKGAAILLVLCFFMPFSKCESKVDTEGKTVTTDSYTYAYETANGMVVDISNGKISEIFSLAAILGIFFLPLICLALPAKWQAVVYVVSSFAAQYWLYLITFFYHGIQIGGALAMSCWAMLFLAGCAEFWRRWRVGRG